MAKGTLVKIEPNGTITPIRVENPKGWTVEELYHLIGNGCDIVEGLRVNYDQKPRIAYVDERARIAIRGRPIPPVNRKATEIYRAYYGPAAPEILGVAVVWIPDRVKKVGKSGVSEKRISFADLKTTDQILEKHAKVAGLTALGGSGYRAAQKGSSDEGDQHGKEE